MSGFPGTQAPRKQRGAGLIEVLIAVLVLAIGMLGIAAMQAAALRNSQSSMSRSQGVVNTYTILDSMRANLGVARSGGYNMGWSCAVPAGSDAAAPTGAGLPDTDRNYWLQTLKNNLGESACGRITCAASMCTIDVRWNDARAGGDAAQTFSTQARL